MSKKAEKITAFVAGVVFIIAILVLAIAFPKPTDFQYTVFRIVLALAAAGFAAMIPGFIEVHIKTWIRGTGALAVFLVVYFWNPAKLIKNHEVNQSGSGNQSQIIDGSNNTGYQAHGNITVFNYAAPTTPEGSKLLSMVEGLVHANLKARLTAEYQFGFTVFGGGEDKFTTEVNEKSLVQAEGNGADLFVNRESKFVFLKCGVRKVSEFTTPSEVNFEQIALVFNFTPNHRIIRGIQWPGIEACAELIDGNPDAPVVVVGFREAPTNSVDILKLRQEN